MLSSNVMKKGGRILEVWLIARLEDDLAIGLYVSEEDGIEEMTFGQHGEKHPLDWFEGEYYEGGLNGLLGYRYGEEARFLIEEGIAPGQPFKVRFEIFRVFRDYWGEDGIDYQDWELLEKKPMTKGSIVAAWLNHVQEDAVPVNTPGHHIETIWR